jgi:hypothetical protein
MKSNAPALRVNAGSFADQQHDYKRGEKDRGPNANSE